MSENVSMIAGSLRLVADNVGGGDSDDLDAIDIREAADIIERLAAENAALKAEVERLTPKPMTLQEACDVLNERKLRGRAWYKSMSESNISDLHNELVLKPKEAVYIAQGLLRDAGPIVVRESTENENKEIQSC